MANKDDPFDLGKTSRGEYKRCIGRKPDGSTHMFVFGHDRVQAGLRSVALNEVWSAVQQRWQTRRDTDRPYWDAATLEVAKAVARGKTAVRVPYPHAMPGEDAAATGDLQMGGKPNSPGFLIEFRKWLAELRTMFPTMVIEPETVELAEAVDDALGTIREYHQEVAATHATKADTIAGFLGVMPTATGPTLAEALDAYAEHVKLEQRAPDGDVSEFGGVARRRVTTLKENLDTEGKLLTPLAQVGGSFLDRWLLYWQGRPVAKTTGQPVAVETVRNMTKCIRAFVRWLNRSDDFAWKRPSDWEPRPVRAKRTAEEKAAARTKRVRYTRDELVVLWQYALPIERLMIALALNCGFGAREIETLGFGEVSLAKKLIERCRTKTDVYGMWPLWDETVTGLKWYLENVRPESDSPFFFLRETGRPWHTLTKGRNRSQTIPNMWKRLYDRIKKDKENFVRLSFNKLRKTLSNSIRQRYGVELANLYLAHGKLEVADNYTSKRFRTLFKVVRGYRRWLAPVFGPVADPFPAEPDLPPNASLSLGKINRIRELRTQGFTLKSISDQVGVTIQTVRRYVPPVGKGKRPVRQLDTGTK